MAIKLRVDKLIEEHRIYNTSRFAEEVGISRTSLIQLKEGTMRVELATIEKLCKKLNITPNAIFEITNDDGTMWRPVKNKK